MAEHPSTPLRLVVMGVAGSGKSTIGLALADRLDARFVDADDLHPADNLAKMAAGTPLTDADRAPWLADVATVLAEADRMVVACSALKRRYRDLLRQAGEVRFVYLAIQPDTAAHRIDSRAGHFMGSSMVESQFEALESPVGERDVIVVPAESGVDLVVDRVVRLVLR